MGLPGARRLFVALAVSIVALLAADAGAIYQLGVRADRPPVFRRGGTFAAPAAARVTDAEPSARLEEIPTPSAQPAGSSGAPALSAAPPKIGPSKDTASTAAPPELIPAAPGTYRYDVNGSEEATGFGSRRLPPTMELRAARDPDGSASHRVFDLRFSSDHEEREIVSYSASGAAFVFEAGSVTFSGFTQTSEADYKPPMIQIPFPLAVGAVRRGTTQALDSGGSVVRTEDWTARVVGQERLSIAQSQLDTWIVVMERASRPGSAEQVKRTRRYWYAPSLGIWVKWNEHLDAARSTAGITFNYSDDYEAVLRDFTRA